MQPVQGPCAAVRLESRNDRTEHHISNPSTEAHDEHSNQNHGISGRDTQEYKANTDQQTSEDTEQLASPPIGQRASEEDAPNETGKGEGADATELLIRQPGLPAKIHPDGSQEHWHEIYRNREADHPGITKSQGVCGIDSALLHVMQCPKHLGRTVPKAKSSR